MCAICGVVNFDYTQPVDADGIRAMAASMPHRGPNDDGFFVEGSAGLGFRRLSIIDVRGGHQPIFNEEGDKAIIFNGEIYNHRELASSLAARCHVFSTRSDTETILHAYEEYGDDCVQHLRGMFAFAIWDRTRRRLFAARDRLGIKPFYFYRGARSLAFASEIKALLQIPGVPHDLCPEAFDDYLSLRYVPGPRTMFRNIERLQPGHTLVVENGEVRINRYWDISYAHRTEGSPEHLLEAFEELLQESVRIRLMSEVPLGLFLSGGLDSSAILALMTRSGIGPVKTFSIGYDSASKDNEFEYAQLAAQAFGAQHREYRLSAAEFENSIPDLVWHLDEPVADAACIPLYCISRLASEHITVVLSGEGADELLAGYSIYPKMLSLDRCSRAPMLRTAARWLSHIAPSETLRRYAALAAQPLQHRYRGVSRGVHPLTKLALIGEERMVRSEARLLDCFAPYFAASAGTSPLNQMLYADAKVWLPDDLLIKADKMTMAHSLELRVPFLDHRLVEFAATLPTSAKLRGKSGKALLRDAMRGLLPAPIIDRPKKGFPVPIASWLRGPLRDFTRDHLLAGDSPCRGYLAPDAVARIVDDHQQGRADRSEDIWTLLVFDVWHRQFVKNHSPRRLVSA